MNKRAKRNRPTPRHAPPPTVKTGFPAIDKQRVIACLLHLLCILTVMASAVFVRAPAAYLAEAPAELRAIYYSEGGVPYLTDLDSYYHARLVENDLTYGSLGDTTDTEGHPWDSLRYTPEGRSADYQPGIVHMTELLWRICSLFGSKSLERAEFVLPVVMSALTALIAYLTSWRMSGSRAGGLLAGLLIGCGPVFASRTLYGRLDTDMFTLPLELLLILFLTEAFKAKTSRGRALSICAFGLTVAAFARCWIQKYSMLFAGLTLTGGLLYCLPALIPLLRKNTEEKPGRRKRRREWPPELKTLLWCLAATALAMLLAAGPSVFGEVLSALFFTNRQRAGENVLPNLFVSVSELREAKLLPGGVLAFFLGYLNGSAPATVNGVGGGTAFLLGIAGIALLLFSALRASRSGEKRPSRRSSALYACVLGLWLVAALFLIRSGIRFIYHLSIPIGLLAGYAFSRVVRWAWDREKQEAPQPETEEVGVPHHGAHIRKRARLPRALRIGLAVLLLLATVLPAMSGALFSSADSRPSVTDASANAMSWIKKNARDGKAVVASWWDMGYFYEYASGHPCLWDGGSQDPTRAILVAKALTADDLTLSRGILRMLGGSGNAAVEYLARHTDEKTAFETIWETILLDQNAARVVLHDRCGLTVEEASEVESLIHPAEDREMYLVLTYTMTRQIGWYEYFANWDFTGTQTVPVSTWYSRMPDGTSLFDSDVGQEYLENVRSRETIWRLFFNAESSDCFTPAYEWHDGQEHVRIWRVE